MAIATSPPSNATTENWAPSLDLYEPSLERAANAARVFVAEVRTKTAAFPDRWNSSGRWLTFSGACGCGKTMLARETFEAARPSNPGGGPVWGGGHGTYSERMRRPGCVWLSATDFADRMRRGEHDLPEYLGNDFLVCVDDLGAARDITAFVADGLYRLANARLGKWTIFTTNLTLPDVGKQIDERVASRMIRDRNAFVKIAAGDYAMRKKIQ